MTDKDNGWTINAEVENETIHYLKDRVSLCGRFTPWWDRDRLDDLVGADPQNDKTKCKICIKKLEGSE